MNIQLTPEMTYENMSEVLKEEFPTYGVVKEKSLLFKSEYLQVRKSIVVAVMLSIDEEKNILSVTETTPLKVGGLIGSLLILLIYNKSKKAFTTEMTTFLKNKYNTTEVQS